jgi:asparagine synthase (glutamine-hydrolysing)
LKPAHNLIFNLVTRKISVEKYFHLESEIEKLKSRPTKERLAEIENLVVDAVEKRLIADVPIGSFLSGGLDSSLISAFIARKKRDFDTFSIGFKEKTFNELPYSIQVAEYIKTKHHYKILEIDSEIIKKVLSQLDEPFGDASILPTYLLSEITREKVTVSLSGDAGDEVFGGYDTYKAFKMAKFFPSFIMKIGKNLVNKLPASDENAPLKLKIIKFFKDYHPNRINRHMNWMSQTDENQRSNLLQHNYLDIENLIEAPQKVELLEIQLNDIHNYLAEDILKKVDIASMQVSLEARVPFLDFRLVPLVLSLPEKFKINLFSVKYLLKKIACKYLPSEIIKRKKQGFSIPLSRWIKESELIKEYLIDRKYYRHYLIDNTYVGNIFKKHLANEGDYSRLLWLVFVFNYWYDSTDVAKTKTFE